MTGQCSERLRWPMLFLWFDHSLIEGWLEAGLRAERHG